MLASRSMSILLLREVAIVPVMNAREALESTETTKSFKSLKTALKTAFKSAQAKTFGLIGVWILSDLISSSLLLLLRLFFANVLDV